MHIMKKESERMLLLVERIREVVVVVELVVVFDGELVGKIVTTTLSQNQYYWIPRLGIDG